MRPLALMTAILLPLADPAAQALNDGHSLEALRIALQSPIPQSVVDQARQVDDQILRTGTAPQGYRVSLVTDERLQRVQALIRRELVAIGEQPQSWVVRLLDTEPKVVNAFVAGGKYVYVFTGLMDQVRSDDELAVVVGHEIGHSVLKHNIRRNSDLTSTMANLATLIGQIKGGSGGSSGSAAMAVGKALHNGYSRDDEREADAFGVLAAWRAGFEPLRGADFFTRLEQADEMAAANESKALDDYSSQALAVKAQCETWRQQWASGQVAHTRQNADLINQRCALYEQARNAYNQQVAQDTVAAAQASMGDHPEHQERIAAIAAETDWLHGARSLQSMQSHPRAYTVIVALVQNKSRIFVGLQRKSAGEPPTATQPTAARQANEAAQRTATEESEQAIAAERKRLARAKQLDEQLSAGQKRKPPAEELERMTPEQRREAAIQ